MKEDNFREGGRLTNFLSSRNKYGMTYVKLIEFYFSSKVPSACFANRPLVGPWCLSDLSQGHPPN